MVVEWKGKQNYRNSSHYNKRCQWDGVPKGSGRSPYQMGRVTQKLWSSTEKESAKASSLVKHKNKPRLLCFNINTNSKALGV